MKPDFLAVTAFGAVFLLAGSATAQTWTQTTVANASWGAVASSADGSRLVATIGSGGGDSGLVAVSTNSGGTWSATNDLRTRYWSSVACSADGVRLVAASFDWVHQQGELSTSTNGGATWTTFTQAKVVSVASSADGAKLVASTFDGLIYTSSDLGATWNSTGAALTNTFLVASSADGSRLVAAKTSIGPVGGSPGPILVSGDSGTNWVPTGAPMDYWSSVACSADGARFVAASGSSIYTSRDSGANWVSTNPPGLGWRSVASSADGTRLVAAGAGAYPDFLGTICVSTNSGANWMSSGAPAINWTSVACSADGHMLVAIVSGGGIWTSQSAPMPALNIGRSGANLLLSWIVPSTDFVLQQNPHLNLIDWTDVPATPALNITNLHYEVEVPLAGGNRFYRLKH